MLCKMRPPISSLVNELARSASTATSSSSRAARTAAATFLTLHKRCMSSTVKKSLLALDSRAPGSFHAARHLPRRPYSTRPPESSDAAQKARKKVTLRALQQMYDSGTPISMLTAYDYHSARYVDQAGIDVCLVGDSLAMTACGYASTNEIGLEEMLYHCRAVARGSKTPLLLADMPFGTHQASLTIGVTNAMRIVQEGGMEAIKVEGGLDVLPLVTRLVEIGIPVMGHIGLMPQRQAAMSGFRVQGKTAEQALQITRDALALQEAGVFGVVLEALPSRLARHIASLLKIPTIGIGASSECAGQVLVQADMLGMTERVPRFCKKYADLASTIPKALREYHEEVKSRTFPDESKNTYEMPEEEWRRFIELRQDVQSRSAP